MFRVVVSLTLFLCTALPMRAHACSLTFAVSNPFPPHHIQSAAGQWSGIVVDLFRDLAAGAGCAVDVVNVPWDRTLDYLERGEIDAVSLLTRSEARARFTAFIGPHYMESIVLIAERALADKVKTPEDLEAFPALIGKTQGTYYGAKLERLMATPQVREKLVDIVENDMRIRMLKAARFGAVFEEASVANHWFNQEILDKHQYQETLRFDTGPVFFGFSKASVTPELLQALQKSWQRIRAENVIEQLHQRYQIDFTPIPAQLSH